MGFNLRAACGMAAAVALLAPLAARAECKLVELAEFHVDPSSRIPVVDGEVNGKPVKVMFDTGSTFSMIPRREAERLGLALGNVPGEHAYAVGGQSDIFFTQVQKLKIGTYEHGAMQLTVAGDRYVDPGVSIVLGDDFFSQTDVEFDLPDNTVRMFKPEGCAPPQLVYWGAAYSQAQLLSWNRDWPHAQTMVFVNGKRVMAGLDTGSYTSVIDANFAGSAGIERPSGAPGAAITGMGLAKRDSWVGRVASFAFGDEKVSNVRLQVLDLKSDFRVSQIGSNLPALLDDTPSMLIGADFFHAHRVYVDVRDHLILFSYSGGPVFAPVEDQGTVAGEH